MDWSCDHWVIGACSRCWTSANRRAWHHDRPYCSSNCFSSPFSDSDLRLCTSRGTLSRRSCCTHLRNVCRSRIRSNPSLEQCYKGFQHRCYGLRPTWFDCQLCRGSYFEEILAKQFECSHRIPGCCVRCCRFGCSPCFWRDHGRYRLDTIRHCRYFLCRHHHSGKNLGSCC